MLDPKSPKRIRDPAALRRKLLEDGECRVPDCGERAVDPHHVVYKSLGGDDVEANIVGLCRTHHDILHFSAKPDYQETRDAIGTTLTVAEIEYGLRRLGAEEGADFLRRAYGVTQKQLDWATGKD